MRLYANGQFQAIKLLTTMREARGVTQQQIADAWEATQANVSQIENTPDIYISTLRKDVEALGGRLEITAVLPDQTVRLTSPEVEEHEAVASIE